MNNDKELAFQLQQIHRALSRKIRMQLQPLLSQFDLRPIDIASLNSISRAPGMTIMELQDTLGLPQSTISSMVKRYQRIGFVNKTVNKFDKRSYCLVLTERAQEFLKDTLRPESEKHFEILVTSMTGAEKQALSKSLHAIERALEETEVGQL